MKIQVVITSIVTILIGLFLIHCGMHIHQLGKTTLDFCISHYHNDTFLNTTTYYFQNDPSEPLQCQSYQFRTKDWKGYCNSTCFENFDKCLKQNATEEQIEFMYSCHWMGKDYLTIAGTIAFVIAGSSLIILSLYHLWREEDGIANQ